MYQSHNRFTWTRYRSSKWLLPHAYFPATYLLCFLEAMLKITSHTIRNNKKSFHFVRNVKSQTFTLLIIYVHIKLMSRPKPGIYNLIIYDT